MSKELADSSEYAHGNMVFFDLLGMVVVAYPEHVGTIINYMTALATFLYLFKKCFHPSNMGKWYQEHILIFINSFVCVFIKWIGPVEGKGWRSASQKGSGSDSSPRRRVPDSAALST